MSISSVIKSIQDIMRKDAGVDGDAQRLGQMSWLLFLKIFDAQEEELEAGLDDYTVPIPEQYLWRNWAADKEGITGDELLDFVNDELFTALKDLQARKDHNPRGYVVQSAFSDAFNYMKNGTLLRQVINKLNEVDFTKQEDRHLFGDIYEQILKDLQSAGNAGEFYTPRSVTQFVVNRVNPQLGEAILDPAAGTGGFLACAIDHLKPQIKTAADREALQQHIHGVEKKQLPHLLCTTNMLLHGIEVPSQIRHGNTLNKPLASWDDSYDIIITNPPFGGTEEDGIEKNFPSETQTRETADLFLQLIVEVLADKGRAAVVLPDGTLFGEGVKSKIKELLTNECHLHTIVRLPNGVFNPYTSIKTNILFFTKGTPTTDIWFYEHPYPEGVKNYSKTKPMKFEEFQTEIDWWGDEADGFASRVETEQAWKVDFAAKKAQARLDAKPHWDEAEGFKQQADAQKHHLLALKQELKLFKEQHKQKTKDSEAEVKRLEASIKKQAKAIEATQAKARTSQKTGDDMYYAVFNFDLKNPHQVEAVVHDPLRLLADYQAQHESIDQLRGELKGILAQALSGEGKV